MSEPLSSELYDINFVPTPVELKLIRRLRQINGLCVVDSDSMTIWRCGSPEYCNGHQRPVLELPFALPLDTA